MYFVYTDRNSHYAEEKFVLDMKKGIYNATKQVEQKIIFSKIVPHKGG